MPFFAWLAIDDGYPGDLIDSFELQKIEKFALAICKTQLVSKSKFGLVLEREPIGVPFSPISARNKPGTTSFFQPDPSAVFGVWNRDWLQESLPDRPFDWLDVFLVSKAQLEGMVHEVPGVREIGYEQKEPHRVNGKYHSPWGWILNFAIISGRFMPFPWVKFCEISIRMLGFSLKEQATYFASTITRAFR